MESDLRQHPPMFLDHHHHQQQMNSGLTRYRSAPSSYFSSIIDREFYEHVFNRPSSPETERMLTRFVNSLGGGDADAEDSLATTQNPPTVVAVKEEVNHQPQDVTSMNNEPLVLQQQQQQQSNNMNNYGSSGTQNFYQSTGRPPLPNQMKTGRGSSSSLIRHGSSPAGLFSNINIDITGMSNFFSFPFFWQFFLISPFFLSIKNLTLFFFRERFYCFHLDFLVFSFFFSFLNPHTHTQRKNIIFSEK